VQISFRPNDDGTPDLRPSFSIKPELPFQPPTVPILEGINPVGPPGLDTAESYSIFAAVELPPDQTRPAPARRSGPEARGRPAGQPPPRQAKQSQPPPKMEPPPEPIKLSNPVAPTKPVEPVRLLNPMAHPKPGEPPYRPTAQDIIRGIQPVIPPDVAALGQETYFRDITIDQPPEQPSIDLLPRPPKRT
jgi:hypothetical protein